MVSLYWLIKLWSREELISDLGKLGWELVGEIINLSYCKDYSRIMVEEQIEKMRELIAKAKRLRTR